MLVVICVNATLPIPRVLFRLQMQDQAAIASVPAMTLRSDHKKNQEAGCC